MGLSYTDLRPGDFFRMHGRRYETVSVVFSKKSRQKGSAQARLRAPDSGAVVTKTIRSSDVLEEVSITKEPYVFVYEKDGEAIVHPDGRPAERTTVPVGNQKGFRFVPSGHRVTAILEDSVIIAITLPVKTTVTVTDAPPAVRGNTAQGGSKKVAVETGATVTVPLFIATGDRIVVKPEDGAYVERARHDDGNA